MIALLAALSASAAAGLRVALPLLVIGLLYGETIWAQAPLLSLIPPRVVLGVLVSWSLFELLGSKQLLGQRTLQIIQLVFSPIAGTILGVAIAEFTDREAPMILIMGVLSGLLALVLQLVQVGWFYRLQGLPLWAIFAQDGLCIALTLFAFDAPRQGGVIALLLLWLAIRSTNEWRRWYQAQSAYGDRPNLRDSRNPRRFKQDPD